MIATDKIHQTIKTPAGEVSFTLIKIERGTFLMGSNKIKITVPAFYMAETPVTQELWEAVTGANPSRFKGKNRPVERVSWNDIKGIDEGEQWDFLHKLNEMTGRAFRLPSESEWEYAAIGGHLARKNGDGYHIAEYEYAGSNRLEDVGWYGGNSNRETKDVGLKMPNRLGLYDMSGNVWEWCEDGWHGKLGTETPADTPKDGSPFTGGKDSNRVRRCGSWISYPQLCRVSNRNNRNSDNRNDNIGFRLACPFQLRGMPDIFHRTDHCPALKGE